MVSEKTKLQALAKRGIELSAAWDQSLETMWREMAALCPDLTDWIQATFGDHDLIMLLMMSRIHDRSSILETLAEEGIDAVKAILSLELIPKIGRDMRAHRGQPDEATEPLSVQAERLRKQYRFDLGYLFTLFLKRDPEIARAAVDLFGDTEAAATFMIMPKANLAGKSPLQMIEEGQRQAVLDVLLQLEHGVFS